ncbi:hypothetical protein tb265_18240 [Gemmatimonadetes bacterium T265]|nr:hypothetical protein tb265_18240 [Gemmatimonadetes bacterium T265]
MLGATPIATTVRGATWEPEQPVVAHAAAHVPTAERAATRARVRAAKEGKGSTTSCAGDEEAAAGRDRASSARRRGATVTEREGCVSETTNLTAA